MGPCAIGGARRYIDGDPTVRYDDPPDGLADGDRAVEGTIAGRARIVRTGSHTVREGWRPDGLDDGRSNCGGRLGNGE